MNNLRIGRKKFKEYYPDIDYYYIFTRDPKDDEEFVKDFLSSKLWRMNNLYTITDKNGSKVTFVMNESQHKVYAAMRRHPRLIILKSRQQGISTFWLLFFFDDAIFNDNFNIGLMAQGADEAATLLERVKLAWDELSYHIKCFLGIGLLKDNTKEVGFNNKSTIFIRTSFRSATLQRLHISEFGKIANKYPERAKETYTGTLQAISAGNYVAIESTAEGDNKFKNVWDTAVKNLDNGTALSPKDFYPIFLSWLYDPDCRSAINQIESEEQTEYFARMEEETGERITLQQRNFWIIQYRELEDDIYQEYPTTPEEAFTISRDGAYYAVLFRKYVIKRKRLVSDLYDKNLLVEVTMDLGMNDEFVLGFWQEWRDEVRLIDEYWNSGEGLEHYVKIMFDKGYTIKRVIVPHDARVKELSTGQSREFRLRELGVRNLRVLPRTSVNGGIEAVRKMLPLLYIDKDKCPKSIEAFKSYAKEWDGVRQVWKDKPLHNKWSNPADMIRYRAVSRNPLKLVKEGSGKSKPSKSVTDGLCI